MIRIIFSVVVVMGLFVVSFLGTAHQALAKETLIDSSEPAVHLFGRDDCGYCRKLKAYLEDEAIPYTYLNIVESEEANTLYEAIVEKHDLSKVTPVTVIGERVIVGYNGPLTTGVEIKKAIAEVSNSPIQSVADHLDMATSQEVVEGEGCTPLECESGEAAFTFDLPFFGVVDLRTFSLFSLSLILGTIDGFNPCAMWVLVTFLVLLSQAGSKKKMMLLAGIFIVAEAVMYNLILNVWYKTWDFVALDQFVTPLVGLLALGGGIFFLWRWHKNKDAKLVCDITDLETQSKTINRFKQIVQSPVTLTSLVAILIIAFSVNIIEFACSIGIPQAYTKILELNDLAFLERQWFILVYTFGYMVDDLVVFGLAIWGFSRLEAHGGKYAQLSLLIGGVLMLLLGAMLILNPDLLVW